MENFKIDFELDFENTEFNQLLQNMKRYFEDQQNNFCNIAFCVYKINLYFDTHYVGKEKKSNEYYDKYKLLSKFGFDRNSISRLSNCYLRFMTGACENEIHMKTWFADFSSSKLFEFLKLSDLTIGELIDKKLITPDMTVKEIRQYIKQLADGTEKAEKVLQEIKETATEEEIPFAYNPKDYYDFAYFQEKNKSQLLNIIWELQKEYQKLKKGDKK